MNTKGLRKGDPCPSPVPQGSIRLYCMRFCPYSERVRLVLAHKKVKYELIQINLLDKPDWYFDKQAEGKVPCLEYPDGRKLYDSGVLCDYLDEVYPDNKLTPSDPFVRAQQRLLMEQYWGKFAGPYYKATYGSNGQDKAALEGAWKALEVFEKELTGSYFGGESPGMLDFITWPWFERLGMAAAITGVPMPVDCLPKLKAWIDRMYQTSAVKEAMLPTDLYIAQVKANCEGSVYSCDVGL